jgi:elongation of very long chain fatty acids protein 6
MLFFIPALLYYPVIFGLKYLVDNLKPGVGKRINQRLEIFNCLWDLFLSIFSFMGAYNCIKHIINNGYNCSFMDDTFWIDLFCYSKSVELLDTVFIVLRGRKLVVLQYYHHFATLLMCWAGMSMYSKEVILGASINYSIHAIMYGYYALYSMGFRYIRSYGVYITFLQTAQMFVAMYNLFFVEIVACEDPNIDTTYLYWYSVIIFSSYVYLFGKLFFEKLSE